MGSPLAPILAGIFMVEVEKKLILILKSHLSCWRRYVDDTISFIKNGSVEHVLSTLPLNSLMKQKMMTSYPSQMYSQYVLETIQGPLYLEKYLTRILTFTGTCLHHFNGNSMKVSVYRAYIVCSDNQHLESKLTY